MEQTNIFDILNEIDKDPVTNSTGVFINGEFSNNTEERQLFKV